MKIFDNGGKTFDRYCVIFDEGQALFMSFNATSPNGVCMHGEAEAGPHLGEEIAFANLPEDCQKMVELERMK